MKLTAEVQMMLEQKSFRSGCRCRTIIMAGLSVMWI